MCDCECVTTEDTCGHSNMSGLSFFGNISEYARSLYITINLKPNKWNTVIESHIGNPISYYAKELACYSLEIQAYLNKHTDYFNNKCNEYALPIIRKVFGELRDEQIGEYNPKLIKRFNYTASLPPGKGTHHTLVVAEYFSVALIEHLKSMQIVNGVLIVINKDETGYYCDLYA